MHDDRFVLSNLVKQVPFINNNFQKSASPLTGRGGAGDNKSDRCGAAEMTFLSAIESVAVQLITDSSLMIEWVRSRKLI